MTARRREDRRRWTFEGWMLEVDKFALFLTGVDTRDLPDVAYADWYVDGLAPVVAAKRAVRGAM